MNLSIHRIALSTSMAMLLACGALATAPAFAKKAEKSDIDLVCKDGTHITVKTTRGACHGHGGIDKDAASAENKKETAREEKAAARRDEAPATRSSGAGAAGYGKVWANEDSKVYHCSGDRWYGKTKHGQYMTEAQAKDKGYRADHGKSCAE